MKHSIRLMLLIALLLPFRGALAVSGLLCHTDMSPATAIAAHALQPSTATADMDQDADHGGCYGAGDEDRQANSHNPACDICASICGAPIFPSADAQLRGLLPAGAERFTAIAPPRAEFALGGLERPPRTI